MFLKLFLCYKSYIIRVIRLFSERKISKRLICDVVKSRNIKNFDVHREYTAMISENPRNIRMPIIPLQYTGRRYWRFYERLNRMIDILRLGVTICAPSERESRNGRFDYKADGQFKGNEYLSSFGGKNGKGGLRNTWTVRVYNTGK